MNRLVVFDLEYTAWPGSRERRWSGPGEHREIVQIGALRLDEDWAEIAVLDVVVRPRLNPVVSAYLTDLTGLTQDRIDRDGVDIAQALDLFAAFADGSRALVSNGADDVVIAENCALFALSDVLTARHVDARPLLEAATGRPGLFSADLPALFGMEPAGAAHDAVADARAVAFALARLKERGAVPANWPSC